MLWFALLLPLAQAAANWHAHSHWNAEETSTSGEKHALAGDHCDLCLTAAALAGGGAACAPLAVAHRPIHQSVPEATADRTWTAPVSPAYQSRAPPLLLS